MATNRAETTSGGDGRKSVDAVVIFADKTPLNLIKAFKPDVLVKGADYNIDTVVGEGHVAA